MAASRNDFRGDFEAVSALTTRAWAGNKDQSLLYTPEFLASAFAYPGTDLSLSPAVYVDDQPAAFVGAFPRRIRLCGEALDVTINTLLTVDPAYQGRSWGAAVWSEAARRTRAAGFAGTISFCIDGAPSNSLIRMCSERLRYPTVNLFTTAYLVRLLTPGGEAPASCSDVELFLELAARAEAPLARVWTPEEALWQCRDRYGAVCVRHECGPRRGMLTGYVMDVTGGGKCLLMEDLLWGDLEAAERLELLDRLLAAGAGAQAEMAVVPRMGYADEEPLLKSRFRKSRRTIHTYLTTWGERRFEGPIASQYIDIF